MTIEAKRGKFLNDTVEHFQKNPRAFDRNNCPRYSHEFNGGCAIGRHLTPELAKELDKNGNKVVSRVVDKLPSNLKDLGSDFLNDCQFLHDNDIFWSGNQLSDSGRAKVELITLKYMLNGSEKLIQKIDSEN